MTGFGANNTSTHADSRTMVFAQNGTDILEGDDGGIYRLAGVHNPLTRRWVSMNTSLRSAEFFSVAYDNVNDQLFGGTMDNGLAQQSSSLGGLVWGRPGLTGARGRRLCRWRREQRCGGYYVHPQPYDSLRNAE